MNREYQTICKQIEQQSFHVHIAANKKLLAASQQLSGAQDIERVLLTKFNSANIVINIPDNALDSILESRFITFAEKKKLSRLTVERRLGIPNETIYGWLNLSPNTPPSPVVSAYGDAKITIQPDVDFTFTGNDSYMSTGLANLAHPWQAIADMSVEKICAIYQDAPFVGYVEAQIYLEQINLDSPIVKKIESRGQVLEL
jgi:hypothetical protein